MSAGERREAAAGLAWRPMTREDLAGVGAVADIVHPGYPEDAAVFAERLALYPEGCLVLEGRQGLAGYLLSHPWIFGAPPKLNRLLGAVPAAPSTYYIHDIALLPAARGTGAAQAAVGRLLAHAAERGLANLSLVAVNGSAPFWGRMGFRSVDEPALAETLRSYGEDARLMARPSGACPPPSLRPVPG